MKKLITQDPPGEDSVYFSSIDLESIEIMRKLIAIHRPSGDIRMLKHDDKRGYVFITHMGKEVSTCSGLEIPLLTFLKDIHENYDYLINI